MNQQGPFLPGHQCAFCGELKRETNQWWLLWITDIFESRGKRSELSIGAWVEDRVALGNVVPACGQNCCQKLVERFLVTLSLDAPRGAVGDPVKVKQ